MLFCAILVQMVYINKITQRAWDNEMKENKKKLAQR